MGHTVRLPDGHMVSDERGLLDMAFVHAVLADAYWTAGRPPGLTERSWAHSLCFGVYAPDGAQAGCARVMTDYTFRAHLGDVMIRPESRGMGLGKALVGTILANPELATVTHWSLQTADAHGLYARFGFRAGVASGRLMTLDREAAPER